MTSEADFTREGYVRTIKSKIILMSGCSERAAEQLGISLASCLPMQPLRLLAEALSLVEIEVEQ